jgi:phospholipid-transporting ATPase
VEAPLGEKNLLLRGSVLRNTAVVDALVVYTGRDSKVALNMRNPPSKLGSIEKMMNKVVVLMFLALLAFTIAFMLLGAFRQRSDGRGMWYMGEYAKKGFLSTALKGFGTFIILYHTFIPISLFVTLEFVRVIQGAFIFADVKMRSKGTPVTPKAGNLHEVLGNIEHILTDKTGTLTQNVMRFVAASAGGVVYDIRADRARLSDAVRRDPGASPAYELARAMALCHAVVPERVPAAGDAGAAPAPEIEYHGMSPDEVALVEAASELGIVLLERRHDRVVLAPFHAGGQPVVWRLLAEVEFSSDRKRMSVVVEDELAGRKFLFTKGADAVMLPLLLPGSYRTALDDHLHQFAVGGLRTLIFGARELAPSEFDGWAAEWAAASSLLQGRAEKQAELGARLEQGLNYIGCTAVEDKLQDRVPETISFMREAGVRIWVLTGDKLETAENIGYSANLLDRSMRVEIVAATSPGELRARLDQVASGGGGGGGGGGGDVGRRGPAEADNLGIIIEGSSLAALEGDESLEKLFMDVSDRCKTVICARVTPSQKAKMVRMARRWRNATTLAIGDGGNDVSMIQEAHIGVGLVGKEGTQAALASDYSMAEFRHLQRLLTVHGRYSYVRTAGVINLSLYKNVAFSVTQILFQFFAFATGASAHDQWVLTMYNAIITLAGPFLYGIFERDLEESTLEAKPSVYLSNRNNRLFSFRTVAEHTVLYSLWHGTVCFFGIYFMFGRSGAIAFRSGRDSGYFLTGFAISTVLVATVQFKFFLSSHVVNKVVLAMFFVSFAFLFAVLPATVLIAHEYAVEGLITMLLASARFHLSWPVIFVVAFLPDFLVIMRRQGILGAYSKDQEVARLQRQEAASRLRGRARVRSEEAGPPARLFYRRRNPPPTNDSGDERR